MQGCSSAPGPVGAVGCGEDGGNSFSTAGSVRIFSAHALHEKHHFLQISLLLLPLLLVNWQSIECLRMGGNVSPIFLSPVSVN